jgi:hypothetical protein
MSLIEEYWKRFNESNKDLNLYSPCLEEFYSKYNKLSKKKYYEYLLESNVNITKYLIVIINNSSNAYGLCDFIKHQMFMNSLNIKIYIYKSTGLEYIIGPINIDSFEKICFITNYIVHYIKRDSFTEFKNIMENDIKTYFSDDSNNKILFYN